MNEHASKWPSILLAAAVALVFVVGVWANFPVILKFVFSIHTSDAVTLGQFGDMFGPANALFSGLAFAALVISIIYQRMELQRTSQQMQRQIHAQLMISMNDLSVRCDFRKGIETIAKLPDATTEAQYSKLSNDERKLVYSTVEFLNHGAHLVWSGLLPKQTIWDSYFVAYKICHAKLFPDWVRFSRTYHAQRYKAFEDMCVSVSRVSASDIENWDKAESERRARL